MNLFNKTLLAGLAVASLTSCANEKSKIAKKWQVAGMESQIQKEEAAMSDQLKSLDTMSASFYNSMTGQKLDQKQFDSLRPVIKNQMQQKLASDKDQAENGVMEFRSNGTVANIMHGKVLDSSSMKWSYKDKKLTLSMSAPSQPGTPAQSQSFKFSVVSVTSDSLILKPETTQPGMPNTPIKFKAYKGK